MSLALPASMLFTTSVTLPIEKDSHPTSLFSSFPLIKSATSVTFTLDEVVKATIRHLHIKDASGATWAPTAIPLLTAEWCTVLRWHIETFWQIDISNNSIYPRGGYTFEHHRYAGELIGEGLSIVLLDKIESIPPHHVFFYKAAGPRPDFVVDAGSSGFLVRTGLIALEARCRQHEGFSLAAERADLKKKKLSAFSDLLAVYFVHSPPYKRWPITAAHERTRILVSDPADEGMMVDDFDRSLVAVMHYIRICTEIGLWLFRDILLEMEQSLRAKEWPTQTYGFYNRTIFGLKQPPLQRRYGDETYEGREFEPAPNRADDGIMFYGINTRVLQLIINRDAIGLFRYRDPQANMETGVSSDGIVLRTGPNH